MSTLSPKKDGSFGAESQRFAGYFKRQLRASVKKERLIFQSNGSLQEKASFACHLNTCESSIFQKSNGQIKTEIPEVTKKPL